MVDKPELASVKHSYVQDGDCCGGDDVQTLEVFTECGGHDYAKYSYIVIQTARWAIDGDQIDEFCEKLKGALKQLQPK